MVVIALHNCLLALASELLNLEQRLSDLCGQSKTTLVNQALLNTRDLAQTSVFLLVRFCARCYKEERWIFTNAIFKLVVFNLFTHCLLQCEEGLCSDSC